MILSSSIHSPLSRAVLLLLVLAMAIATSGPANATGSEESRISQTREELERVRGELNAARGEADDDMIALEDADALIARAEAFDERDTVPADYAHRIAKGPAKSHR